jgi:hypothetical protein
MWCYILGFIVIILLIIYVMKNSNKEHFEWEPRWKGPQSRDCYSEKPENCLDYANCGFCLGTDGAKKCIFGDADGPLFQERCPAWAHSNFYDRYIFNEKVTTIVPSWAQFYPDYEAWYPFPGYAMTL